MLNITIRIIPHEAHRYPTCGDWIINHENSSIDIFVSNMDDWKKEALVAVHELVEALFCMSDGIKQEDVDKFDKDYELNRAPDDTSSEPGNSKNAPYHIQHVFATIIEQNLAHVLGVDWNEYEKTIEAL